MRVKLETRVAAKAELEVEVQYTALRAAVTASSLCCSRSLVDTNRWMDGHACCMESGHLPACILDESYISFHLDNDTVRYLSVSDKQETRSEAPTTANLQRLEHCNETECPPHLRKSKSYTTFDKSKIHTRPIKQPSQNAHQGKQESIPPNFPNTTACSAAPASPFVVASPTLTLTKHPPVPTTTLSLGNLVPPHVLTSLGVAPVAPKILLSTNVKSAGDEQVPPLLAAGKLTLSQMFDGR